MVSKKRKANKEKASKNEADRTTCEPDIDMVHDEKGHSASVDTITTSESSKKRGKRSVVQMYKVLVKKAVGKKIKVAYNDMGNICGQRRHTLQSYIGMLVRKMIPINIESWPEVDCEDKEKLWIDVQDTFKVAPESKKMVLASAGTKWRQFKTNLTNKHVLPYLGNRKKLRKPPKGYAFVGLTPWREFVKQRSTEQWLKLHHEQRQRVKKRKYHHKLSRKGYIGLEEELRQTLPEGEVIDRAVLWKKARVPKNGKMDEEVTSIAEKIDELLEKKSKGELIISGSDDVLTQALQTPEHSGRLRGVGGYVNATTYFNLPKRRRITITKAELLARDRERDRELQETQKFLAEQAARTEELFNKRLAELEARLSKQKPCADLLNCPSFENNQLTPISDKGSFHGTAPNGTAPKASAHLDDNVKVNVDDCEIVPPPTDMGRTCELAVDTISNIVAFGTVIVDESLTKTIHGVPFKDGCLRVSVDGEIQGDARLPCPVLGLMELVREAIGSHVAWPEELVIRKQTSKNKKKKSIVKSLFDKVELHPFVPKRFKLLYKHAKTIMQDTSEPISTMLDDRVFGVPKELYILTENVTDLLEMNWIGQGVIAAYMAHLHDVLCEREELDTFAFIDPAGTCKCERPGFHPYLVDRLKEGKADRIFFMPYNPGQHWILTIIWEDEIYMLDSLPKPVHYQSWENAVLNAVKAFNAETGRKVPKVKLLSGVPKQPGGFECGYYVMRYMKDIINDDTLSFSTKWAVKRRSSSYTQEQLDEVRIEVADYVQNLL